MSFIKPTETKTARQTTPTVTVSRTTRRTVTASNIFVVVGCVLTLAHMLTYIPNFPEEGILHWKWMSSFLDAMGWAMLPLFFGFSYLMHYNLETEKYQKKGLLFKATAAIGTGVFHISYCLISIRDFQDYPRIVYYLWLLVIAIICTFILRYGNRKYIKSEIKFRRIISVLGTFIVRDAKKHVQDTPEAQKEYKKDYIKALEKGME